VDARNLADQHDASDLSTVTNATKVDTHIFYPGNGRSAYLGARAAF